MIQITGQAWRMEYPRRDLTPTEALQLTEQLLGIFSEAFDARTLAGSPSSDGLKSWPVQLRGPMVGAGADGSGFFYCALGPKTAVVGFLLQHSMRGDVGASISAFKSETVDALGVVEVVTDDTIASFEGYDLARAVE